MSNINSNFTCNIAEMFPDPILILDTKGKILWCNKATYERFDFSQKNIIGEQFTELQIFRDQDISRYLKKFAIFLSRRTIDPLKVEHIRKDGKIVTMEARPSFITLSDGKSVIQVIVRDMSELKAAELSVHQERNRAQQYLDVAAAALIAIDITGNVLMINKYGKKLLGIQDEDVKGMNWFETFIPLGQQESTRKEFEKVLKGDYSIDTYQNFVVARDGTKKLIRWVNIPLKDKDGQVTGTLSSGEDITDTVRIQEALNASIQLNRELLENLPAGVGMADMNKILQYVNLTMCNLMGYGADELIGTSILDYIIPEDHDRILSETEIMSTGKSASYETKIVGKNGEIKDVQISSVPRRNEQGVIIGTICIVIDISDTKSAQEELAAGEKRLGNLIEELPLGIVITDLEENIKLVNQAFAEILLLEKTSLIGTNLTDYINQEHLSKIQHETERRRHGIKSIYIVGMTRRDGFQRSIKISAAPDFDVSGSIIGSVGIYEDITEQKRKEIIRLQQEREIELYSNLMRHDFANDLGLIFSYIETIQMLLQSPDEEIQSFLNSALATVDRMVTLLKNFGRLQKIREVDIVDFITEISEEAQAAENNLGISVSYKKGVNPIRTTAGGLISLVFMNLFRNAAQHAGDSPKVEVQVSKNQNQIEIIVSDNGPGVPEEFQDKLFRKGTSSKGERGGVGLQLCRQIIRQKGGSIELLKEKKGATFRIVLPINE
ncbi:MAG: PAS domain S-box protein [Candidatus Thorarchaeota archaeon]